MPEFTSKLGNRVVWDVSRFVPMMTVSMPGIPGREKPVHPERQKGRLLVRWEGKQWWEIAISPEIEAEIDAAFATAKAASKESFDEDCRVMGELRRQGEIRDEEKRSAGDRLDEWLARREGN